MVSKNTPDEDFLKTIRWIARIVGSLFIIFSLLFLADDIIMGLTEKQDRISGSWNFIKIAISISFITAITGLIIAFWKESTGGLIGLTAMLISFVFMLYNQAASFNLVMLVFLVPSFLYLLYWSLSKRH